MLRLALHKALAWLLTVTVCLPARGAPVPGAGARARLWDVAARGLRANRVRIGERRMLTAGRSQFGSMWTRDFAFASRGLLAMGDLRTVRDHLDVLLDRIDDQGLLPRALDSIPIWRRVTIGMIRGRLGLVAGAPVRKPALQAQVLDEHGSPAMDGNLLVILAALDYVERSGDVAWGQANRDKLRRLFRYYARHTDEDGLLVQPRYSDWQDSVRREGKSFYLNLLHAVVARRLGEDSGLSREAIDALDRRVHETFFDPRRGLYRSLVGRDQISLDGNLLALDLGFVAPDGDGRALYAALKQTPLWTRGGVPGSATYGNYPLSWLHLPARLAGLRHYHDELHWSWLTALSAKVADRMGDHAEAQRIFERLAAMAERDGSIAEIYREGGRPAALRPFRSLLYRSEAPFSWGAGVVLDALAASAATPPIYTP